MPAKLRRKPYRTVKPAGRDSAMGPLRYSTPLSRHPGQATAGSASRDLWMGRAPGGAIGPDRSRVTLRSEEHTSELQSLMRISYAVFCLKIKKRTKVNQH